MDSELLLIHRRPARQTDMPNVDGIGIGIGIGSVSSVRERQACVSFLQARRWIFLRSLWGTTSE
jgi:hypothetical protein